MIVLDTDVVSELVKPAPSQPVVDWIDVHDSSELVITALTAADIGSFISDDHR